MKYGDFLDMFCKNAWQSTGKELELNVYTATFLIVEDINVYAYVSENSNSIYLDENIGVSFLRVKYDDEDVYTDPLGYGDIKWLLEAFDVAEENLLEVGIPFIPSYEFHGKNKKEKEKKNKELRKKLNVEAYEEECWKRLNERIDALLNKKKEDRKA